MTHVSVILPTYERREAVQRAIDSVLAQAYEGFELIVVDDGSTDGTADALARYGDRIRLVRRPNGGAAAARNAGLAAARGELVAFLDSDDRWLPGHLALVAGALDDHPDAVLAVSLSTSRPPERATGATEVIDPLPRMAAGNYVGCLSAVAARRDAVAAARGFDERLGFTEDAQLWLTLALTRRPFVIACHRTVESGASPDSIFDARRPGEYADELELGTLTALEGAGSPVREWLTGRLHLVGALRALAEEDPGALDTELGAACRLLSDLAEQPWSMVNHARFDLGRSPGRAVWLRRVALLGRSWRRLGLPGARDVLEQGWRAAPALPSGRLQQAVVRTEHGPLRPVWAAVYEAAARGVGAWLRRGEPDVSVFVRGSMAGGEPLYGVSDIDLVFVAGGRARAAEVERETDRRWKSLTARMPAAFGAVFERPHVYDEAGLEELSASSPFTHGPGIAPTTQEQERARAGAERARLYGIAGDWRLLAGPDRRPAPAPRDAQSRRIACWLELQFWWLQAFRVCAEPSAPWAANVCAKLMIEPARGWLWLVHGERVDGRRALIRRALEELESEQESLRTALALLHISVYPDTRIQPSAAMSNH